MENEDRGHPRVFIHHSTFIIQHFHLCPAKCRMPPHESSKKRSRRKYSVAADHPLAPRACESCHWGLNPGPPPYQGGALPLSYGSGRSSSARQSTPPGKSATHKDIARGRRKRRRGESICRSATLSILPPAYFRRCAGGNRIATESRAARPISAPNRRK
jgi:hypothetical protein